MFQEKYIFQTIDVLSVTCRILRRSVLVVLDPSLPHKYLQPAEFACIPHMP